MVTMLRQTTCPVAYTGYTRKTARTLCSRSTHSKRRSASGVSNYNQKQFRHVPIEITYPGSGNNSQITFDGVGRGAKIIEQSGGSTTSTKQLVWCGQSRCEERNGAGTVAKKFFQHGQTISGLSYFNSLDHLGSIRELTDSSGTIQAQYAFDPYGRVTKLQGSLSADFQYAGYYTHAQSGLNFTRTRAYNCTNGRWISRDPVNELGGINLYLYVYGNPINFLDPTGLGSNQCCIDWDKVRDAANWGTVGGAAIGGYIGSGAGAIGGGVAGGGVGAIPGSAAGTYGGAAAGAAIGGFGAGAASIAGQMAGNLMSSGSGSGSSGAGAGTNSGTIDCSPHPCDPPKFLSTFGECTRYCDNNCKAEHNAACRSKCLRRYGNSGGDRGGLPPVRQ